MNPLRDGEKEINELLNKTRRRFQHQGDDTESTKARTTIEESRTAHLAKWLQRGRFQDNKEATRETTEEAREDLAQPFTETEQKHV